MSNSAKLSQHKFKKGKFIAPFNDGPFKDNLKENPWLLNRMPEYLWLSLILHHYGRHQGLFKVRDILKMLLKYAPDLNLPRMSDILSLPIEIQRQIYTEIKEIIDPSILIPLTAVITNSHYPEFANQFVAPIDVPTRIDTLNSVMSQYSFHQSNEATDIRFLVLSFLIFANRLYYPQIDLLLMYPNLSHDHELMRMIRPSIRAAEIAMPDVMTSEKEQYLSIFWNGVSKMSDCELFYIDVDDNPPQTTEFMNCVKSQLEFYTELFQATRPMDNKMLVLLGIATYSYKRLLEVVEHNLYHTIAGRSTIRVLIEDYIMMKYLLKHEKEHDDIWTEYQYYGIGQYKLVVERYLEKKCDLPQSHVRYDYIDLLVSEYKNKDFIDMDTSYFGKKGIRDKAIDVDEKALYDFFYDYDSAFEHGLWGAIRESSLVKCNTPSHQYHCVPDIENNQKMQSIWPDCMDIMNRTLAILHQEYSVPRHLLFEEKHEK